MLRIGIVREYKNQEGMVALTPWAVAELVRAGQDGLIEAGAGVAAGFDIVAYQNAGAQICRDTVAVYAEAELLVKVKEPQALADRVVSALAFEP